MKTFTILIISDTRDKVSVIIVGFVSEKNMFIGLKVKNKKNTKQQKERCV